MKCKVCHNTMIKKHLDIPVLRDGSYIILKGIEGFECDICGERVFDESSSKSMLGLFLNGKVNNYIRTPVLTLKHLSRKAG